MSFVKLKNEKNIKIKFPLIYFNFTQFNMILEYESLN